MLRINLFLIIAVLFFATACRKVEAPKFLGFRDFKLNKIGLKSTEVGFSVAYFNPNNFCLNVKEADIDLYLDSSYVGKFKQSSVIGVAKKSEFAIPLKGTIPLDKMLQMNFQDLINKEVLIKVAGTVSVGKAGIFVKREINYLGKHTLNVQL